MEHERRGFRFHLIAHTHWDREWYLPAAGFLPRLVDAVGELLDLLERDSRASFVLDGQTILLEDVLRVRPSWRSRIVPLVESGRLEIGPWYILSDMLIPSGESLIRNLLTGAGDARALGGHLDVWYSPDAFGHPAASPMLARQFGLRHGVIWRGLGDRSSHQDLYRWQSPDGSEMLLYHLPRAGYEIGADLAAGADVLPQRWPAIRRELVDRAKTDEVAVFVGADHHAPPLDPAGIRAALHNLEPAADAEWRTLKEYFAAVERALALPRTDPEGGLRLLPAVSGELRRSHGYTWALQGVHGTRSRLKRRFTNIERFLTRAVDPLVALARWRAGADRTPTLRAAWRELLRCQFHDTLAGTCSDPVAREQDVRLTNVAAMGTELLRRSMHALIGHDPDRARTAPSTTPTLLVWNPVPRPREGVVVAEITALTSDVLVGPPSGRQRRLGPGFVPFILADRAGALRPVQVLSVTPGLERLDADRHYPAQGAVDRVLIAFDAGTITGLGAASFAVRQSRNRHTPNGATAGASGMTNRFLELHEGRDGRVDLFDRRSGERYRDVVRLIDEVDQGDSYSPWVPPGSPLVESMDVIGREVLAAGPFVAASATRFRIRTAASGVVTGCRILIMHAESPVLRLRFELDNRAIDHRLRLRTPVGTQGAAVAGAAFGFERRESFTGIDADYPLEYPARTAPAHRFVAAGTGSRGMAMLCPGFFEYEWVPGGDLLLTLVRSIGDLSRDKLPSRPGHAAWPTAIPDAQETGPHLIECALVPLAANEADDVVALEHLWEETHLPLQSCFTRDFVGDLARLDGVGISLQGDGLVCTAVKPFGSGPGVIVRCYNTAPVRVTGRLTTAKPIARAALLRADETMQAELPVSAGDVAFEVPPRGIATVLLT
ncbi:MAG: hypothetical protein ACREK8_07225 [Gemmatimonadales bacterium]